MITPSSPTTPLSSTPPPAKSLKRTIAEGTAKVAFGTLKLAACLTFDAARLAVRSAAHVYTTRQEQQLRHRFETARDTSDASALIKCLVKHPEWFEELTEEQKNNAKLMSEILTTCPGLLPSVPEVLRKDYAFMMPLVIKDPSAIEHAHPDLLNHWLFMQQIIQTHPTLFAKASETLRSTRTFLKECLVIHPQILLELDPTWQSNKAFLEEVLTARNTTAAHNPEFMSVALRCDLSLLSHLDDLLKHDPRFIEPFVSAHLNLLPQFPLLASSKEVMDRLIAQNPQALLHAAPCLLSDRLYVLDHVRQHPQLLSELNLEPDWLQELHNDLAFMQKRVLIAPNELTFAPGLLSDLAAMRPLLRQKLELLAYVPAKILNDPSLLMELAQIYPTLILSYAPLWIKKDAGLMQEIITRCPNAYAQLDPLLKTRPNHQKWVTLNPALLTHLEPSLAADSHFILSILKDTPHKEELLQKVAPSLLKDSTFVFSLITLYPQGWKHVGAPLSSDPHFISTCLKKQPSLLMHLAPALKTGLFLKPLLANIPALVPLIASDPECAVLCAQTDFFSAEHISSILQHTPEAVTKFSSLTDEALIYFGKKHPRILQYLLRPSAAVVDQVAMLHPDIVATLSPDAQNTLNNNYDRFLALAKLNPNILKYAPESFLLNPGLMLQILEIHPEARIYLPLDLRNHLDFLKEWAFAIGQRSIERGESKETTKEKVVALLDVMGDELRSNPETFSQLQTTLQTTKVYRYLAEPLKSSQELFDSLYRTHGKKIYRYCSPSVKRQGWFSGWVAPHKTDKK